MRNNFSDKLKKLDIDFNKMCALCQNSLDVTLKALSGDVLNVETGDELKQLKSTIEEQCVNMLLEESPVASDFRVIMATLLMIADLNRIAAQSSRINKLAKLFKEEGITVNDTGLDKLGESAIEMFRDSMKAVVDNDGALAAKVINSDNSVDDSFADVKHKIAKLIVKIPESGELLIDLVLIAKYYERIGDHSVNVARLVNYKINGIEA